MKVFSDGSATWREWRTTGLLIVYVGECAGSRSVGRPRKRWTDTAKDCLKKRGLNVWQERRMVHDKNVKRVYVGECTGSRSVGRPRKG